MTLCPPKTDPSWISLVSAVGEFEATRDWMENDYQVRTPEQVQEKLGAPFLSKTETQQIQGELGADKKKLISLLGNTMYQSNISDVVLKELLQNSFDATKSGEATGEISKGKIDINISSDKRTIGFTDNGVGMSPEIVQKAFFTIGGSYKPGVSNELKSGGLGLAKMAFIFGSDWIEINTVNNRVETYVKATSADIQNDNFKLNVSKSDKPNGTSVTVKIPESYINSNGDMKDISFPYQSDYDSGILGKPLLGNTDVTHTYNNHTRTLVLGKIPPGYQKLTSASTSWANIDIYFDAKNISMEKKYGSHPVLSSGLYQFTPTFRKLNGSDHLPLDLIINIKPKVDTTHEQYPFNNQREGFRKTVSEDLDQLEYYLAKFYSNIEKELLSQSFSNIKSIEPVDLTNPDEAALKANQDIIKSTRPKETLDQIVNNRLNELRERDEALEITELGIKTKTRRYSRKEQQEETKKEQEKKYRGSFKAEKELTDTEGKLSEGTDPSKPIVHNNTNLKLSGKDIEYVSKISTVMLKYKDSILKFYGNDYYNKLKDQMWGVSIDKTYGGVNVRPDLLNFLAINPFYVFPDTKLSDIDVVNYIAVALDHLIIHEFNHNFVRNEGSGFTGQFISTYSQVHSLPDHFELMFDLKNIIKDNLPVIKALHDEYHSERTKNVQSGLKGNEIRQDNTPGTALGNERVSQDNPARDVRPEGNYPAGDSVPGETGEIISNSFATRLANVFKSYNGKESGFFPKGVNPALLQADLNKIEPGYKVKKTATGEYYVTRYNKRVNPFRSAAFFKPLPSDLTNPSYVDTTRANEIANKLLQRLTAHSGINVVHTDSEGAKEALTEANQAWNGEPTFTIGDTIYVVSDKLTTNMAFHEFSHPIFRSMWKSPNKQVVELFHKLYDDLSKTDEGRKIISEVEAGYKDLVPGSEMFKEEVLVRALAAKADNLRNDTKESAGFIDFIKNILYAIRQFIRKVFKGPVRPEKLDQDTTLDQLADMLVNDHFQIDTKLVSQADLVAFYKEYNKLVDELSGSSLMEKIQPLLKQLYSVTLKDKVKALEDKNYPEMFRLVQNEFGLNLQSDIRKNIGKYKELIAAKITDSIQAEKLLDNQARGFIYSMYQLETITKNFNTEMESIRSGTRSKADVLRVQAIMESIRYYEDFLKGAKSNLLSNGLSSGSDLIRLIDTTINNTVQTKSHADPIIKEGMEILLTDVLKNQSVKIDELYNKVIDNLKSKGASASLIKSYQDEYDSLRMYPGKIKAMLSGMGDAGILNNFLEGWTYSADEVVGGMGTFFKNTHNNIQTAVQDRFNDFINQVEPLLKQAGINPKDTKQIERLLFIDHKDVWENGELKKREVFAFLNLYKDYRWDIQDLNNKINLAQEKFDKSGDPADGLILNGLKAEEQKLGKHFFREFKDEFYAKDEIFNSPTGIKAKQLRDDLWHEINLLTDAVEKEGDLLDIRPGELISPAQQIEELHRQLKQLASFKDLNDEYKTGEDLEIAKILQRSQETNRHFYEYKLLPGKFQMLLSRYEQELINQSILPDSEEYMNKRQQWIDHNTVQAVLPEFYDMVREKYDQIRQVYESVSNPSQTSLRLATVYKEITDTLSGYRDQDGQPVGSDMSPKTIEKIKSLQEEANKLQKELRSGLTEDERHELSSLLDQTGSHGGAGITLEEGDRIGELIAKADTSGLTKFQKADLARLWKEIALLQSKQPTEYYLDVFNNYLSRLPEDLKEMLLSINNSAEITSESADYIINLPTSKLRDILDSVPGFKDWFLKNHIRKTIWDAAAKKERKIYQRVSAWSVMRPLDNKHMEHTNIFDQDGNVTSIQGRPSLRFYERLVKDEFKTKQIIGKTVDVFSTPDRPRFLPRSKAEGAPSDKYINQEYLRIQSEDPKLFAALEKIKELYLDFQHNADNYAKLGYDFPRIRKHTSETLTSQGVRAAGGTYWDNLKAFFTRAKDDPDSGYNLRDEITLTNEPYFDNLPNDKPIPVTGIYDLNVQDVSLDMFHGVAQYMAGVERQKQLKEILPFFRATKDVLSDPANAIRNLDRVERRNWLSQYQNQPFRKGDKNVRLSALNNKMQREFYGQANTGLFANNKGVNSVINAAFRGASFSYLAVNLPAAVANMTVQITQNVIRSASGEQFSTKDLLKGSIWAGKASVAIASEIHSSGVHSLDVQITEIFDPVPGRYLQSSLGRSQGRSSMRDLASVSWLYSPRKFMENYATLEAFGAMMHKFKVLQNGKEIPYIKAWELKDGKITLKQGIDQKYAQGGEEFNRMINMMQQVQYDMNGAYDSFSQPEAHRYILYRMYSFLRRYVTTMLTNRFALTRRSPGMMDVKTGFYTSTAKLLWRALTMDPKVLRNMSGPEKAAAKQFAAEISLVTMMFFMYGLFGWDPDDKERYAKLRQKSGPLPLPFVTETENPFQTDGWLSNHALLQLLKLKSQTEMWIPLPNLGLKDYTSLPSMVPVALGPTIDSYAKIFNNIAQLLSGDERAYYQRTIGPYDWQQEGNPKLYNYLAQMGGARGATVTPELAIQKQEQAKVLK